MTDDNKLRINGLTADEWESVSNPQPATESDLQSIGILEAPQAPAQAEGKPEHTNKVLQTADKMGLETPNAGKVYKDSKFDAGTIKDAALSLGVEASHIFAPKSMELQYESKTKVGETMKYGYRYLAGTASLFLGGGLVGGAIKGVGVASKIPAAVKIGSWIQKLFAGTDIIKTGAKASGLAKVGAKIVNASLGGAFSGALADYTLYRPEDGEGHMADAFGDTNNTFVNWLQSDDNDTETDAKFKNVVEGFIMGLGTGNIIEFGVKPIFGRLLKNIKVAIKADTPEVAEAALKEVALDEIKLDKFSNKADMYNSVKGMVAETDVSGEDASQLVIDRMNLKDIDEAQSMLKVLQDGDDVFLHEDGTWDIKVSKWDDAHKVSKDEYIKQSKAKDLNNAKDVDKDVFVGDSAISDMEDATKHTWTNRGWIGENEDLTPKTGNKIAKNYKDKWQIDNNIKVEFVDGLKVKGEGVEGNTQSTTYLGKNKQVNKNQKFQNSLDKKNLQIKKLEAKLELLGTGAIDIDSKNKLIEEIRIAKNEALEISKELKPKEKLSDITIQIDKNAKNPFTTLRAELEHARDITKGEVPNQSEKHFSRYDGVNEGEAAYDYVYKKSAGKAQKIGLDTAIKKIKENVSQYLDEGYEFKTAEATEGAGEHQYKLLNNNQKELGHIEYSTNNKILDIGEVKNTTKRKTDKNGSKIPKQEGDVPSTPDVAEKLVDKLISEHPDKKIKWDAVTPDGVDFKQEYLNKHPELKDKIVGITNPNELDREAFESYNSMKKTRGINGKTGNTNNYNNRDAADASRDTITDNNGNSRANPQIASKQMDIGDRTLVSSDSSINTRGKITNPDPSPEQLKIDFDTKVNNTQTTEDLVDKSLKGEIQPQSMDDIGKIISKVADSDPEITGHSWKEVADDSEKLFNKIQDMTGEDISAYKEAFLQNDIDTLDKLTRYEMAATKVLSTLSDRVEALGMYAPLEAQKNIIDMIVHISKYVDTVRSGAGRLLNEQKFVNRALNTFGSMRLSSLAKQGIKEFSDLLVKDIKEIFNLNFTRGEKIDFKAAKQELFTKVAQYGDGEFLQLLTQDAEFAKGFNDVLDNLLKNQAGLNSESAYKQIEDVITASQYREVLQASKLAPTKEGKIKTIKNWSASQGGIASYYVHNLLSGLGSIAKNIGSGTLNSLYFPARKVVAGFMGGGEAMTKEGWNTYKNMMANWTESWELCKQAFIKGEGKLTNVGADTLNLENDAVFRGFHDLNDDNLWHKVQNIHSIMTRAMGASDEFMSQLNYRSIARAKCLAQADKMAELAGKTGDETFINDTADRLFKTKFDSEGKPTDVDAYNEARTILYQNNLDGKQFDNATGQDIQMREPTATMKLAQFAQTGANKNAFIKFIFPFVKTGANILQMNLDHNAIYAALSPSQRKLLLAKTPEGAMARSQVAFGMFSLSLGTMMAANGLITGSAPPDIKERKALFEAGWRPYSFKMGDTYVSYQGYEPLHTMLGFSADCFNLGQAIIKPEDEDKWKKFSMQASATLVNNFMDKAAFRTGLNQLSILTNPEKIYDWQKAMAQTASGFLPDVSMVKGLSSLGEREITEPKSGYERLFNNYFNRGLGDYRRDVFGDRQDVYGLLVTTAAIQGNEPEYQELSRLASLGYIPTEISLVIANSNLKFKDFKDPQTGKSSYDAMQEALSQTTIGGRTLKESIRELVTSSEYRLLPNGIGSEWNSSEDTRVNAINDIFRDYNDEAKEQVINDNPQFINKQGQSIQEAKEILETKKMDEILNNQLNGSAEKIRSLF